MLNEVQERRKKERKKERRHDIEKMSAEQRSEEIKIVKGMEVNNPSF